MMHRAKRILLMRTGHFPAGLMAIFAGFVVTLAAPGGVVYPTAAAQTSCQIDFGILTKKRMEHIAALNRDAKRRKGKLDPRTACPRLRSLAAAEAEMLTYMKKNKAWCGIPDQPIEQMTATRKKTATLAGQACKVAAQIRKGVSAQRGARGPAAPPRPKLPAGPL